MEFNVKIEGLDRLDRSSKRVIESITKELNIGLYASAKKVEREAKQSILSGEKTGRIYQRRTVTHQASAPGQAPASDTGRLVNSINGDLDRNQPGTATVKAGGGIVKYARMLEFGTSKMAARPFFHPALEKSKAWIRERLNKAVRDGVAKAIRK